MAFRDKTLPERIRASVVLGACGLAMSLLGTAPMAADWLVTVEGARIETDGPWEVKGRMIVFTRAGGGLSSMRLAEVDLPASDAATAAAVAPPVEETPQEAAPPPSPPVLVLTNRDVGQAPRAPSEDGEGSAAAAAPAPPAVTESRLEVTRWDKEFSSQFGGLEVRGALRNTSKATLTDVSLKIRLFDDDGKEIGSGSAFLARTALPPGMATEFRWPAENITFFSDIRFEPSGVEVFLGVSEETEAEDDGAGFGGEG